MLYKIEWWIPQTHWIFTCQLRPSKRRMRCSHASNSHEWGKPDCTSHCHYLSHLREQTSRMSTLMLQRLLASFADQNLITESHTKAKTLTALSPGIVAKVLIGHSNSERHSIESDIHLQLRNFHHIIYT